MGQIVMRICFWVPLAEHWALKYVVLGICDGDWANQREMREASLGHGALPSWYPKPCRRAGPPVNVSVNK